MSMAGTVRSAIGCPACGIQTHGEKFCEGCGAALAAEHACVQCKQPLAPGAKFCGNCGAKS